MSSPGALVGVDAGEALTLVGIWPCRPDWQPDALPPSWPIRESVPTIAAFAGSGATRVRAVQSLLAGRELDPAGCVLVGLRGPDAPLGGRASCLPFECTPATRTFEMAVVLGIPFVILPARVCALTIRGLLFADSVKEYTRMVPPHAAGDLALLREYFADMMEQAAEDVQVMGLEQDDSLLDHFADMRLRGQAIVVTVPVESLGDVEWLRRNFEAARKLRQADVGASGEPEIVGLHTRCVISTPQPGWRPAAPPPARQGDVPPGWTWQALTAGHVICRPAGCA